MPRDTQNLDPFLPIGEVAALLNVGVPTIRRWIDAGKVTCWRTPGGQRRVRLSAVEALLEEGIETGSAS